MKTFDEIKNEITKHRLEGIERFQEQLVDPKNVADEEVKNTSKNYIQYCKRDLDNIDELTTMKIARNINDLIKDIQYGFYQDIDKYFKSFDDFVNDWVINTPPVMNEEQSFPNHYSTSFYDLGMTKDDLECLRGTNPDTIDFGDKLRQKANDFYGINIPMGREVPKAKRELDEIRDADSIEYAQAFVNLKEKERDAGEFWKGGVGIVIISDIPQYQDAKKRISAKSR